MMDLEGAFSRFPTLQIEGDSFPKIIWITHPRLKQRIVQLLANNPEISEETFVRHLLDQLKQKTIEPFNVLHLTAFMAHFCVKELWKVHRNLSNLNRWDSDAYLLLEDLFQITLVIISDPQTFFKNFDHERGNELFWYPNLRRYIAIKIEGKLRDEIRGMQGLDTVGRSATGLASRSSQRRVLEALRYGGLIEPELSQYKHLWQCLQEAKQAKVIDLVSPTPQHFQKIADLYNTRGIVNHEDLTLPLLDAEMTEERIKAIGNHIRELLNRRVKSLDVSIDTMDEQESTTLNETIADPTSLEEMDRLSLPLISDKIDTLKQILENKLNHLDSDQQATLKKVHGSLPSKINASTELQEEYRHILRNLIKHVVNWSKEDLGIVIAAEFLGRIRTYLREFLDAYYSS